MFKAAKAVDDAEVKNQRRDFRRYPIWVCAWTMIFATISLYFVGYVLVAAFYRVLQNI